MLFKKKHHQRIAKALENLDAALLKNNRCYFGGGTALALMHGEYRESNDIDFMVSSIPDYRHLRALLTGPGGFEMLARRDGTVTQIGEIRADQYGIRGKIEVDGVPIKMEIVLEGRIELEAPAVTDTLCGVCTLCQKDLAAEKMLANSDRWGDVSAFNRDLIDLAMSGFKRPLLLSAIEKAETAYGVAIKRDIERAIERVLNRNGWLDRCIAAMEILEPKASLMQRLMVLGKHCGVAVKLGDAQS